MAEAHDLTPPERPWPASREEMRARARHPHRAWPDGGEQAGGRAGGADEPDAALEGQSAGVVGVRCRESSRVSYFQTHDPALEVGAWVVVPTARGREAARVVIAPRQVLLAQLEGELKPVERRLDDADVERMEHHRREAAQTIRRVEEQVRARRFPIRPIAVEYALDRSSVAISYSASEPVDVPALRQALQEAISPDVRLQQVGPWGETRLLGGLGRGGRMPPGSSWLPVSPHVSMVFGESEELPLTVTAVSGAAARLLCRLSYEDERFRMAKAILPRLGQRIATPAGEGMVVSLQVAHALVTVRLDDGNDRVFPEAELLGRSRSTASELSDHQPNSMENQ